MSLLDPLNRKRKTTHESQNEDVENKGFVEKKQKIEKILIQEYLIQELVVFFHIDIIKFVILEYVLPFYDYTFEKNHTARVKQRESDSKTNLTEYYTFIEFFHVKFDYDKITQIQNPVCFNFSYEINFDWMRILIDRIKCAPMVFIRIFDPVDCYYPFNFEFLKYFCDQATSLTIQFYDNYNVQFFAECISIIFSCHEFSKIQELCIETDVDRKDHDYLYINLHSKLCLNKKISVELSKLKVLVQKGVRFPKATTLVLETDSYLFDSSIWASLPQIEILFLIGPSYFTEDDTLHKSLRSFSKLSKLNLNLFDNYIRKQCDCDALSNLLQSFSKCDITNFTIHFCETDDKNINVLKQQFFVEPRRSCFKTTISCNKNRASEKSRDELFKSCASINPEIIYSFICSQDYRCESEIPRCTFFYNKKGEEEEEEEEEEE
jgi:hypothetical protein